MSVMNKEELSMLILENQKEMYVLAYSILKNQADAQDAVSECIVRAFENRTSLRKRTSARSWLMKILINVSRSAITKRQKVVLFADPEQYEQEPETAEDHLWSVILELPENVRVVMVLFPENYHKRSKSGWMNWQKNIRQKVYSQMEVFCRFRINLKLYQIRFVFWFRTVPFICQRKH